MTDIMVRKKLLINTDPQRRCYDGCHYTSELVWSPWEVLEVNVKNPTERLKFWNELNDDAVSERGNSAKSEFKTRESR